MKLVSAFSDTSRIERLLAERRATNDACTERMRDYAENVCQVPPEQKYEYALLLFGGPS